VFGKPVMLTETNTEYKGRVAWLRVVKGIIRDGLR
jgi:hypothetical protein